MIRARFNDSTRQILDGFFPDREAACNTFDALSRIHGLLTVTLAMENLDHSGWKDIDPFLLSEPNHENA